MEKELPMNPPAFPVIDTQGSYGQLGMDLRDYFANNAMSSLVDKYHDKWEIHRMDFLAEQSYKMADAMLIERQKQIDEINKKRQQNINGSY